MVEFIEEYGLGIFFFGVFFGVVLCVKAGIHFKKYSYYNGLGMDKKSKKEFILSFFLTLTGLLLTFKSIFLLVGILV